jgi:hypothetical protein
MAYSGWSAIEQVAAVELARITPDWSEQNSR